MNSWRTKFIPTAAYIEVFAPATKLSRNLVASIDINEFYKLDFKYHYQLAV